MLNMHPNNNEPFQGNQQVLPAMESSFRIWTTNRNNFLSLLENHSLEQLNKVPAGFNNNLIWNIGHVIIVQQRLVYKASGLPMHISEELFNRFKPGSRPDSYQTAEAVNELKELLLPLVSETKRDFAKGSFVNYKGFTTSAGFNLASIEDAIQFNNYHEALHFASMMSIRRFI